MARYDLSAAEWGIVEPLLPPVGKGKPLDDDRRVVDGIFLCPEDRLAVA
jgi:transposase